MADELEILKADRRTSFHNLMFPVLEEATKMSNFYNKRVTWEDSIFSYNEISAVSILSSAAWSCEFISVAEYATEKKARTDLRKRANGRVDLWIMGKEESYGFEFKFLWKKFSCDKISEALRSAKKDARSIPENEADCRVGGIIATTFYEDEKKEARKILQTFAEKKRENCEFAYRIGSKPENTATFFFFDLI